MKNLQLISMLLVSHREKKARKIEFHPDLTIIQGANDTGKSSVIKTILSCFGATPHKIHAKWKAADVISLIHFKIDKTDYSIYRHRNSYTLFDASGEKIESYTSVTNELAPALAKIFDFNLKLTDRDGKSSTPPPAYFLLPFYIDQDAGWINTWNSFTNLSQYAYWKKRVIGYHVGLRPDKWYGLEANRKQIEQRRDEPQRQIKSLSRIEKKTIKELSSIDFDIDIGAFKTEIEKLLTECSELKALESKYRTSISNLTTEKIRLEAQLEIVAHTRDELNTDYNFASSVQEHSVDCPTCGAEYENSFSERFAIAQDAETCTDLLSSLRDDLAVVNKSINTTKKQLDDAKAQQSTINDILERKQGKLKLQDLIDIQGKKSLMLHLTDEIKKYHWKSQNLTNKFKNLLKTCRNMMTLNDASAS